MGHFKELNIIEIQQQEEQDKELQLLQPCLGNEFVSENSEPNNVIILTEYFQQNHLQLVHSN